MSNDDILNKPANKIVSIQAKYTEMIDTLVKSYNEQSIAEQKVFTKNINEVQQSLQNQIYKLTNHIYTTTPTTPTTTTPTTTTTTTTTPIEFINLNNDENEDVILNLTNFLNDISEDDYSTTKK